MILNDAELNVILAALRACSMAYKERSKEAEARGDRIEATKTGAFAEACGQLSNRLELERPAPRRSIIMPN